MRTYPDQNDIVIDIDQICVVPKFDEKTIELQFVHQHSIKHTIDLDEKTSKQLLEAFRYATARIGKGIYGAMVINI